MDLKHVVAASDLQYPQAVDLDDGCSLFNVAELPNTRSTWVHAIYLWLPINALLAARPLPERGPTYLQDTLWPAAL